MSYEFMGGGANPNNRKPDYGAIEQVRAAWWWVGRGSMDLLLASDKIPTKYPILT